MLTHDNFVAMILTNAKRVEARSVVLTVAPGQTRIDLLLLDGSSQPMTPPPAETLLKIIELLETGQRTFESSVFAVSVNDVKVQRGPDAVMAQISSWDIEHT